MHAVAREGLGYTQSLALETFCASGDRVPEVEDTGGGERDSMRRVSGNLRVISAASSGITES